MTTLFLNPKNCASLTLTLQAVATLTPVPLLAALAYYRARASYCPLPRGEKEVDTEELQEKEVKTGEDAEEKKEIKMIQEKEMVA